MALLERLRARLDGHRRVSCRTEQGFRTVMHVVPLPGAKGVRLETGAGNFLLTPLETGHLRDQLRDAIETSAVLSVEDTK
ncbi:hypothetical protein [Lentzea sp. CA-135723]|uniref:hypothetical protein n=1 Tax=Lentzea sp. CA-135723 TaxID=3239950 RepID=UPI003D8A7465